MQLDAPRARSSWGSFCLAMADSGRIPPAGAPSYLPHDSFGYDKLHRLVTAGGGFTPRQGTADTYSLTMAYDAIHNITGKSQAHQVGCSGKTRVRRGESTIRVVSGAGNWFASV